MASNDDATRPIDEMSVKELKALLNKAGESAVGITEKSELRTKAREAKAKLDKIAATNKTSSSKWTMRYEYENGATDENAELIIVLMHGLGSNGDNLAPLAEAIGTRLLGKKAIFIFPTAPEGYWFPLNPMDWMVTAMQNGQDSLARLIRTEFNGIPQCRINGEEMIQYLLEKAPHARLFLGGFSQGAMTSTDIALHHAFHNQESRFDGIIHLSGAPIDIEVWASRLQKISKKPRIYISHGRQDMVLPFFVSDWSNQIFTKAGCQVAYHPHPEGHTVGPIDPIAQFILAALNDTNK